MGGIFNELTHYHMHVIPRYEGQSFAKFYSENEDNLTTATYDFNNELFKCVIEKSEDHFLLRYLHSSHLIPIMAYFQSL